MERLDNPALKALADAWSVRVFEQLDQLGREVWPPLRELKGLLPRPRLVERHWVEGPAMLGEGVAWAVSHTVKPSAFDERGRLSQGEREYWLALIRPGSPPLLTIEGAEVTTGPLGGPEALVQMVEQARRFGPRRESFYGNKGPLSHP